MTPLVLLWWKLFILFVSVTSTWCLHLFTCAITDADFYLLKPEMKMRLRNFLICAFCDN